MSQSLTFKCLRENALPENNMFQRGTVNKLPRSGLPGVDEGALGKGAPECTLAGAFVLVNGDGYGFGMT